MQQKKDKRPFNGVLDGVRIRNLRLRRPTLYPVELRAQNIIILHVVL